MAVQQCIECGGKVSDKAAACPHCGVPVEIAIARPTAELTPSAEPVTPTPPASVIIPVESPQVTTAGNGPVSEPIESIMSAPDEVRRLDPLPTNELQSEVGAAGSRASALVYSSASDGPPARLAPPAIPYVASPSTARPAAHRSYAGRNVLAFLLLIVFFAGAKYVPDYRFGEGVISLEWLVRLGGLVLASMALGDTKENSGGWVAFWAAAIVAYFLTR